MIHITNGDDTVGVMRAAGFTDLIVPWRDVLHEGPVPTGIGFEELSRVRVGFISDAGWGHFDEVKASFAERDRALANYVAHNEVVLWFEHDLYDQLQLIQVLDWFSDVDLGSVKLTLIAIEDALKEEPFSGLGELSPERLRALFPRRVVVEEPTLDAACDAWAAFRSSKPDALVPCMTAKAPGLPFLGKAFKRMAEQYPAKTNGLSRTTRQMLLSVLEGQNKPADIFRRSQEMEEFPFMGDTVFWSYLEDACSGENALLETPATEFSVPTNGSHWEEFHETEFRLTELGTLVLEENQDLIRLNGIDRWFGGVHLSGNENIWRWDPTRRHFEKR